MHFELREYDPVIGRWMAMDPKRIGFTPYFGMNNNPVNLFDPDGGSPPSDYVNAQTGERKHIDDDIDVVVVIEDKNWDEFLKFFEMTSSMTVPSNRFGILSRFGTNYMVTDILKFYEEHRNPQSTEWGSFLYSEGVRVFKGPEAIEGEPTTWEGGGAVWFFEKDAMLPNPKAKMHLHYPPLEQNPSEPDRSTHGGNDIYNIVVSEHDVHFYRRGHYERYNEFTVRKQWVSKGVDFSIPKSSFRKP